MTMDNTAANGNTANKPVIYDRPFVYGSIAFRADPVPASGHSHRWTVYVRGLNNEDMSSFIKHVTFQLHETYTSPTRTITQPPYHVNETGWGEFDIEIVVTLRDKQSTAIKLSHHLKLFHTPSTTADDTTTQSTTSTTTDPKQPVISEHYDEFVFRNVDDDMIKKLNYKSSKDFSKHELTKYFDNESFAIDEAQCIDKLQTALNKIAANIHIQRNRLYTVNNELKQLGIDEDVSNG